MPIRSLLLLFALLSGPATAAAPDAGLRQSVATLAALVSDGHARLAPGPIEPVPTDAASPVAVLFTLEGVGMGNGSWQFVAFFARNETMTAEATTSRYRLLAVRQIGATGQRQFDPHTASMKAGRLHVTGAATAPGDAMCCPSVPVQAEFELRDGSLVELPADPD